jgi:hypothetical protein
MRGRSAGISTLEGQSTGPENPAKAAFLLFTWRTWSISCHGSGFSTDPSCLNSKTCSIFRQLFETRHESQGRQSTPPRYPLCLTACRFGPQPPWGSPPSKLRPSVKNPAKQGFSSSPVTFKPLARKSHIFSPGAPCLFLKQMFEFRASV